MEAPVACPDDRSRFIMELEFVSCLANPHYLTWLAQNRHFEDPAFVKYLAYLNGYWRRPEYVRYLRYPHSLFFLDLLQSKEFRTAVASEDAREMLHTQQFFFWQHYRQNRVNELMGTGTQGVPAAAAAPAPLAVEAAGAAGG